MKLTIWTFNDLILALNISPYFCMLSGNIYLSLSNLEGSAQPQAQGFVA